MANMYDMYGLGHTAVHALKACTALGGDLTALKAWQSSSGEINC